MGDRYAEIPKSNNVINFHTTPTPELPEWFKKTDVYMYRDVKMCIGAGDNPENIQNMLGYDVYVSLPDMVLYNLDKIKESIALAEKHNKLLIFIGLGPNPQTDALAELFKFRLSLLDYDDHRPMQWLQYKNAVRMVVPKGILMYNYSTSISSLGEVSKFRERMNNFTEKSGPHPLEGKQKRLPEYGSGRLGPIFNYFVALEPAAMSNIIDLSKTLFPVLTSEWVSEHSGPYNIYVCESFKNINNDSISIYADIVIYIYNQISPNESERIKSIIPSKPLFVALKRNDEQLNALARFFKNNVKLLYGPGINHLNFSNINYMIIPGGAIQGTIIGTPANFECKMQSHPLIEQIRERTPTISDQELENELRFKPTKKFKVCIKQATEEEIESNTPSSNNEESNNNNSSDAPSNCIINTTNTRALSINDPHFINFDTTENPTLPDWFADKTCLKVCIAAGDGYERNDCTDVERLPEFDVYCCYGLYDGGRLGYLLNLQYILDKYPQQKLICYMDSTNANHLNKFATMLQNKCQFIGSDDDRFFIKPDEYGKRLLMIGGKLISYPIEIEPGREIRDEYGRWAFKNPVFKLPTPIAGFECKKYTHDQRYQICTKISE